MKKRSKISLVGLFILGLAIFSGGLQAVARLMTYGGIKHNFMAENWVFPSTYLLGLIFAIGWWLGYLSEQLLLNNKRRIAIITFLTTLFIYGIISFSSFLVSGFASSIIEASGAMILSSFVFRLSVMKLEVMARIWEHNKNPISPTG